MDTGLLPSPGVMSAVTIARCCLIRLDDKGDTTCVKFLVYSTDWCMCRCPISSQPASRPEMNVKYYSLSNVTWMWMWYRHPSHLSAPSRGTALSAISLQSLISCAVMPRREQRRGIKSDTAALLGMTASALHHHKKCRPASGEQAASQPLTTVAKR